jgi:hypothetical protein
MSSFPFKTNPIYKIHSLIDDETIDKIIVFYGIRNTNVEEDVDINTLFKTSPKHLSFIDTNTGLPIFTDDELTQIQEHNIDVIFTQQQIHFDDSIGVIKLKIIDEFIKLGIRFSLDETYLFAVRFQTLDPVQVYQSLTQNEQLSLTRTRLNQFLLNIIYDENHSPVEFEIQDKEIYDYDDILALNISGKIFGVNHALDKKLSVLSQAQETYFIVNPFDCDEYDKFTQSAAIHSSKTLNKHLLLDHGEIIDNNIYLCCAQQVLTHAQKLQSPANDLISMELYVTELYYPFLVSQKITSLNELENQKYKLMEETEKYLTENALQTFQKVDMFYDIYKQRQTELNYYRGKMGGVQSIQFTLLSSYKYKIPLEVIFKLIHATEERPLVKFNPAIKRENVYRLYADKYAEDGRKIPFLQKATIFKLMKEIGKSSSVSVYIQFPYEGKEYQIICEFQDNGNIRVSCEFEETIPISYIDELFKTAINPVIEEVKVYLEQNGYSMNTFVSLFHDNVEINHFTYSSSILISKNIQLERFTACVKPFFVVETDDHENNIVMRYKRVSNFNKMNSIDAFVLEKSRQGLDLMTIIDEIVQNYDVSPEEAKDTIRKVLNETQYELGSKNQRGKQIKITNNPGFKTTFKYNKFTQLLNIQIENIDSLYYLYVFPIYLDTLIRISQDVSLCSEVPNLSEEPELAFEEEIVIPDIVENLAADGLHAVIENGEVILTDEFEEGEGEREMDAFDLLFGDDDEGDGEGDEDAEDENADEEGGGIDDGNVVMSDNIVFGGAKKKKDNTPIQKFYLDGLPLKHPNPFQQEMERLDPILFQSKKKAGKFEGYSRMCLSNNRVQPVILTDEERANIEKERPGFFRKQDILRYGSDLKNPYNYICPRYWCMKTNRPMTQEEVDSGVCGKVIPKDAKAIPQGHYVYEFFSQAQHGSREKYIQHYPGFIKDTCMPCCYKNWNTPDQMERRNKCIKEDDDSEEVNNETGESKINEEGVEESKKEKGKVKQPTVPKKIIKSDYIKGPEKFPLGPDRWGYLPVPVQMFFKESSVDCQVSNVDTNLKKNYTCMLRHGVETHPTQSFIACIADILFYGEKVDKTTTFAIPTIREMKEKIIDAMDLDTFLTLQNGDLLSLFTEKHSKTMIPLQDLDIRLDDFKTSALYSRINMDVQEDRGFFQKSVGAFLQFLKYLRSNESTIDYTYLWDIICKPNSKLFNGGLNLIILEIPNTDSTNNVELICPTNHYSNEMFNPRYPTAIIIQQGEFFEPVYFKTDIKDKYTLKKTYKQHDSNTTPIMTRMKEIFAIIKNNLKKCTPLPSISKNIYKFKQPLLLDTLIGDLEKLKYIILQQVMNYQGKVIALFVQSPQDGDTCLVPCYPSSPSNKYEYVLMNRDDLFSSYERTVLFLKKLSNISKKNIPSLPKFKVLEDEIIIGVLTETNQFIQVSEPIPVSEIKDDLETLRDTNYFLVDKKTMVSNDVDIERVEYIQKIKLETKFYNLFRNTIRILLNKYENIKTRKLIEDEIQHPYTLYETKLKNVIQHLTKLVKNTVVFSDEYDIQHLDDMSTCIIINDEDKCNRLPLCSYNENTCQMIIPNTNLLTGKNNMIQYYGRMSDELVRYNRINAFIFQPQTYHSFGSLGYHLREDEIIIIQSLLNQEYFNELIAVEENKFVYYNTHDTVQPIQTVTYSNFVPLQGEGDGDIDGEKNTKIVQATKRSTIHSTRWVKCFPSSFGELEFKTENKSFNGFSMLIDIVERVIGDSLTLKEMKHILLEEYEKYLPDYKDKILNILVQQGKVIYGNQVKSGILSFENFIFLEEYHVTNLDIWIILEKFGISTILISTKKFQENDNYALVINGEEKTGNFVFILCPSMKSEKLPEYSIVCSGDDILFPVSIVKEGDCREKLNVAFNEKRGLDEYLRGYTKRTKVVLKVVEEPEMIVEKPVQEPAQEPAQEPEVFEIKVPKKRTKKASVITISKKTRKIKKPKSILEVLTA